MILYLTSRHSNEKTMVRLPYPCHHLPPPATSPPHTPHATPCNDIIFYVLTIFFFCLLFSTSFVALILLIPFFNVFLSLLLWLCFGKMQNKNSSSSHNPASRPFLLLPLPLPGHSLSLCFFFLAQHRQAMHQPQTTKRTSKHSFVLTTWRSTTPK